MINLSFAPAIFLFSHPPDMRKNYDGLSGMVTTALGKGPLRDGALVFVNLGQDRMKILVWDRQGKSHTDWYWGYYAPTEIILVFDFQMSREQHSHTDFLKDFKGGIQCDDYGGYNKVRFRADIVRMACMAHVRRKFNDAIRYDRARCGYTLETIRSWFACEVEAKEKKLEFDQRLQLRREMIGPSEENSGNWFKKQVPHLLPHNPATKAAPSNVFSPG